VVTLYRGRRGVSYGVIYMVACEGLELVVHLHTVSAFQARTITLTILMLHSNGGRVTQETTHTIILLTRAHKDTTAMTPPTFGEGF